MTRKRSWNDGGNVDMHSSLGAIDTCRYDVVTSDKAQGCDEENKREKL